MSTESLISIGFAQLAAEDYDGALETSEKLIAKKSPEGHALKGNALVGLDRVDDALAAVDRGIQLFPDAYSLQTELGVILTTAGRYEEAETALQTALAMEDTDPPEVGLALAALYAAQERWDDMLEVLAGNEDWGELEIGRLAMQLSALAATERWDDAYAFTQGIIDESGEDLIDEFGDQIAAAVHAVRAMGLLEAKDQPKRAINGAWEALRINPFDDMALLVIRKAAGKTSENARTFAIECEVAVEGEEEPFDGGYVVLADDQDEALEYIEAYEAQVSGGAVTLVAADELTPIQDEFCGILEVAELGEEEEEDDFPQN